MGTVLVIGGFDPTGSAGIVRDLRALHGLKVSASVVLTATTLQSDKKFFSANVISVPHFRTQLKMVGPLGRFAAIKIGMLGNEAIVRALVAQLEQVRGLPPIVLDPLYASTSGGCLLTTRGQRLLLQMLVPLVSVWLPNQQECLHYARIAGLIAAPVPTIAPSLVEKFRTPLYLKGIPHREFVEDSLYLPTGIKKFRYRGRRGKSPRGTGCCLASLISGYLALGHSLPISARLARRRFQGDWACTLGGS